jgi:phage terminase large subunit GpA-like protein
MTTNRAEDLWDEAIPEYRLVSAGNPADWAKKHRRIAAGESPLSQYGEIPFSFDHAPWCEEPCREAINPEVTHTVLQWGSGCAKTLGVFFNVFGWIVDEAPRHVLWALKTQEQMAEISKKQIQPAILANPRIYGRTGTGKSRDSSQTITFKSFPGGSLSMIGTESIVGFRANRSPCVIGDEIDSWSGEVADEGDPLQLLFRRSDGFENAIRLIASTPGTKGKSRIEAWMAKSDYRVWKVPCLHCGHRQVIMWKDIQWPKGEYEKARWLCQKCKEPHTDTQRRESVRAGLWDATLGFSGVRGYWLNGFNNLMPSNPGYANRLHQWAKEVSDAAHSDNPKEAKKVIVQTLFCETWEDEEDAKPPYLPLLARRERYDINNVPKGVVRVTVGTDLQRDRIEAHIIGWGRGEEMWCLRYLIISGDPKKPDVWHDLEKALNITIKREDGKLLPISSVGIDTSDPSTQSMAYDFVRPRQPKRWFAFKGSSQVDYPVAKRSEKSKVTRVTLMGVGVNRIKGRIYDRALNETPGTPGFLHFPSPGESEHGYEEGWFKQLFAETSRPEWKDGQRFRRFECPNGVRNEALDTTVYAYAALHAMGPCNWDWVESELKSAEIEEVTEEKPPIRQSMGFVGAGSSWMF